jgi:heat shock protein HslJ
VKRTILLISVILLVQCKGTQQGLVASLENTYWKLTEAAGKPVTTPEGGREVHMILSDTDNQRNIKGFAGCNGLGGDYTVDGNKIRFSTITTRMFCELQMEVENRFTQALTEADRYEIRGETLDLYKGDVVVARFEKHP